jgi:hypothetical protein
MTLHQDVQPSIIKKQDEINHRQKILDELEVFASKLKLNSFKKEKRVRTKWERILIYLSFIFFTLTILTKIIINTYKFNTLVTDIIIEPI